MVTKGNSTNKLTKMLLYIKSIEFLCTNIQVTDNK